MFLLNRTCRKQILDAGEDENAAEHLKAEAQRATRRGRSRDGVSGAPRMLRVTVLWFVCYRSALLKKLKPQTLWHDVTLPNLFNTENKMALFVRSSHEGFILTHELKWGNSLDCTEVALLGPSPHQFLHRAPPPSTVTTVRMGTRAGGSNTCASVHSNPLIFLTRAKTEETHVTSPFAKHLLCVCDRSSLT